jgi:hypothetical protein
MEPSVINAFIKRVSRYHSKKEIVELCFKSLIDSYQRVRQIKGIDLLNENMIRDKFVVDLERENNLIKHAIDNHIIIVVPESWDAVKRRRADIRFILPFIKRNLIFECKKLYSAERRYLDEGLARFVRLEYSEKEDDAGMIGFVINPKSLINIISGIKGKVCQFHFSSLTDEQVLGWPYSFQSVHVRMDFTKILIYHLFFEF